MLRCLRCGHTAPGEVELVLVPGRLAGFVSRAQCRSMVECHARQAAQAEIAEAR